MSHFLSEARVTSFRSSDLPLKRPESLSRRPAETQGGAKRKPAEIRKSSLRVWSEEANMKRMTSVKPRMFDMTGGLRSGLSGAGRKDARKNIKSYGTIP